MRKITSGFVPALVLWAAAILPSAGDVRSAEQLVPVEVQRILLVNNHPAVVLANEKEHIYLLVYVDHFMAQAIQLGMLGMSIERPLTHDLIGILLRRLGAQLSKVSITELKDNTYYALISLRVNGNLQEIDARPSDALAIAVRSKSPIFVARSLMSDRLFPEGEGPSAEMPGGPVGQKHGA
jgi:bifunctional DNase/RNase